MIALASSIKVRLVGRIRDAKLHLKNAALPIYSNEVGKETLLSAASPLMF